MEFVSSGQPLFRSEEDRENAGPQDTRIKSPSLVISPYPPSTLGLAYTMISLVYGVPLGSTQSIF
ncbi:hypothetical protein EI94DRAFT_1767710 [Lactarius quietus]|nr:hypothetical protein EI94DRAFT_1767710 [Lactarius quietus]